MDLNKLKKRRAAQKAVISRHLQKLEDSTDDCVQFRTISHNLQSKLVAALEELNENIISQTDEDDFETEMVETEDYMLDLKIRIGNLEAEQRQPSGNVVPPQLLNPIDPPLDEPPMNNSANIAYHSENTSGNTTNSTSDDQAAILHSSIHSRPKVLLKTAVAKETSGNLCTDVNILYGEGAQRSFITKELAESLELRRTGTEVVKLAAFDSSSKKAESQYTHLDIVYTVPNNTDTSIENYDERKCMAQEKTPSLLQWNDFKNLTQRKHEADSEGSRDECCLLAQKEKTHEETPEANNYGRQISGLMPVTKVPLNKHRVLEYEHRKSKTEHDVNQLPFSTDIQSGRLPLNGSMSFTHPICFETYVLMILLSSNLFVAMEKDQSLSKIQTFVSLSTPYCSPLNLNMTCPFQDSDNMQLPIDRCEFKKMCSSGYTPLYVNNEKGMAFICAPVHLRCEKNIAECDGEPWVWENGICKQSLDEHVRQCNPGFVNDGETGRCIGSDVTPQTETLATRIIFVIVICVIFVCMIAIKIAFCVHKKYNAPFYYGPYEEEKEHLLAHSNNGDTKSNPGEFKKDTDDTNTQAATTCLNKLLRSCGAIILNKKVFGSAFRVGECYVMTDFHVIRDLCRDLTGNTDYDFSRIEREHNLHVNFNGSFIDKHRRDILLKYRYHDEENDCAVLEIKDTELHQNLPDPLFLWKYDRYHLRINEAILIGYGNKNNPNEKHSDKCIIIGEDTFSTRYREALASLQQNAEVYKIDIQERGFDTSSVDRGYYDVENERLFKFDCFLEKGASGAPVITNEVNSPKVIGLFIGGKPDFFYELSDMQQAAFEKKYLFEVGVKMNWIYQRMEREDPDLASEIFPTD